MAYAACLCTSAQPEAGVVVDISATDEFEAQREHQQQQPQQVAQPQTPEMIRRDLEAVLFRQREELLAKIECWLGVSSTSRLPESEVKEDIVSADAVRVLQAARGDTSRHRFEEPARPNVCIVEPVLPPVMTPAVKNPTDQLSSDAPENELQAAHGKSEAEARLFTRFMDKKETVLKYRKQAHSKVLDIIKVRDGSVLIGASGRNSGGEAHHLHKCVHSMWFETTMGIMVVLNAFIIGFQVQMHSQNRGKWSDPVHENIFDGIETAFTVVFSIELVLRLAVDGRKTYHSEYFYWNMFDSVIVGSMILDFIFGAVQNDDHVTGEFSVMRLVRILRMTRVLRVVKLMRYVRELRVMFSSILGSLKPLFWVCIILTAILYVFGVALTVGTVEYLTQGDKWDLEELNVLAQKFGRLDLSILSLFEAMTGGISWGEQFAAIQALPPAYSLIFITFIVFTLLGLLNILTGVFVDLAFDKSKKDEESIIQSEMADRKDLLRRLGSVFDIIDEDAAGTLSLEEFKQACADERVQLYLSGIGLGVQDAESLFVLLDRDQEGCVDIQEFLDGCLKLQGQASKIEVAKVELESKWILQNIHSLLNVAMDLGRDIEQQGAKLDCVVKKIDFMATDHVMTSLAEKVEPEAAGHYTI